MSSSKKNTGKGKRNNKITNKVEFLKYLILVKKIVKKKRVVKVVVLHLNQRVMLMILLMVLIQMSTRS